MIFFTATPVILIGIVHLNLAKFQKYPLRVKYGKPDTNKEYLFVGTMVWNRKYVHRYCTVSLIAERWVLTAAHCLEPRLKYVRFGDLNAPLVNATFRFILKMFPHPSYKDVDETALNDIGLVLIREIKSWTVGKLTAMDFKSLVGLPVKYAGCGATYNYESVEDLDQAYEDDKEKPLQVGEGVIVRCEPKDVLGSFPAICVAPKCSNRYADAAGDDSGGPLFFQSKIVGVVSSGPKEKVNPIGRYTPISPYLDWITFVMMANHDHKKLDDTAQRSSVL